MRIPWQTFVTHVPTEDAVYMKGLEFLKHYGYIIHGTARFEGRIDGLCIFCVGKRSPARFGL